MSRSLRLLSFLLACLVGTAALAGDRALTFPDLMKFRQIRNPVISDDGAPLRPVR